MKRTLVAVMAGVTLAGAAPSLGAAAQPRAAAAALSPADRALVAQATASLQAMNQAKGRFIQTDPNGATSQGTFYLQRPGKIRFEYDPARPLLVVSDGSNVKIYDRALKTFDQYPLGATPLSLFLAREVRLDRGVILDRVERRPGGFAITARDGRKQAEGRIELVFAGAPAQLSEWTVIDPRGQRTRVRLNTVTQVAALDPKLFVLRDPTRRSGRP
jgi:outer membrane lipoprotein-sorting protein